MQDNLFAKLAAAFVLVGTLTGGVVGMETRYAKAADINNLRQEQQRSAKEVKALLLSNARENARARLFDFEQVGRLRALRPEEARRLQELRDEIADLTVKINTLEAQLAKP